MKPVEGEGQHPIQMDFTVGNLSDAMKVWPQPGCDPTLASTSLPTEQGELPYEYDRPYETGPYEYNLEDVYNRIGGQRGG
jgi:hypothetical protein